MAILISNAYEMAQKYPHQTITAIVKYFLYNPKDINTDIIIDAIGLIKKSLMLITIARFNDEFVAYVLDESSNEKLNRTIKKVIHYAKITSHRRSRRAQ